MSIFITLVTLVLAYLIGSIPSGLIIVKVANGKDVRQIASGRTGGTNAMRAAGLLAGLLTAALDVLKGISARWLVGWLSPGNNWLLVFAALMTIVGHNYSIFLAERNEKGQLRLRGGAGGATTLGGAIALWLPAGFVILPLSVVIYLVIGYASVTTMSVAFFAMLLFAYQAWMGTSPWVYALYGLLAEGLVMWALRPNLQRLRQGNERPVGLRALYLKRKEEQAAREKAAATSNQAP